MRHLEEFSNNVGQQKEPNIILKVPKVAKLD